MPPAFFFPASFFNCFLFNSVISFYQPQMWRLQHFNFSDQWKNISFLQLLVCIASTHVDFFLTSMQNANATFLKNNPCSYTFETADNPKQALTRIQLIQLEWEHSSMETSVKNKIYTVSRASFYSSSHHGNLHWKGQPAPKKVRFPFVM